MKDGSVGFMSVNLEGREWNEERVREWKEYDQKIAEIMEAVLQKAKEKLGGNKGELWFREGAYNFGKFIRENNKDYSKYAAYHRVGSSTTTRYGSPKLDLPKPYSVKDFCTKLMEDLDLMEGVE